MSSLFTLLCYDYLFHDAPLCLLFPRCCPTTTFSMMLHYVSFFHAAALYMTTFSTLLRYISLFHDAPQCLLFHADALCLLFPRCCAMTTISMMLHYDYFFNAATLCLPYSRCYAMTTFSMMLHYVSFFHAAVLYMTTFSTLLRYISLFHDAPLCLFFPR